MTKERFKRMTAFIIALVMVPAVFYMTAGSLTAKAAVTQSQIDTLKKQQKETEQKKQALQSQINSLQYQQKTALEQKQVLDEQVQLTQGEIDNINEQITEYDQLIAQKEIDVRNAQGAEDAQWAKYKANMREMEESGTISYISVIFQANSFSDLLARIDFIHDIMQYDQNLYKQLEDDKQATINAKNELQAAKEDQESDRTELTQKASDLNTQLDQSNQLLQKLEDDINTANTLYDQEIKAADQIQNQINQKIAELKAQQKNSGGSVSGTGTLTWPAPSCYIVTSPFGMRFHPIYHEYRMHYGIDIGVKYGSDIVAADGGTVIISDYDSSYGNYIVISHGKGVTTLYAHLSQRLKKAGDAVKKGDLIAKSGSTGDSTGPHLHFEVSVNGTRVNPLQYFTGYTKDY